MKKLFIGLGITFLIILIVGSALLLLTRRGIEKEQIKIPAKPEAPMGPMGSRATGKTAAEQQAAAARDQAKATEYQASVQKYEVELIAYNDALNRQQEAQQRYDDQRKSYLLYAVILICVLAILALISFTLAGFFGKRSVNELAVGKDE
ncbi:MAG: hypothetical protein H5T73_01445 [Actinobacteria bacterium]|nr:hypothetical protein [Actinomycetota bacterium]